MIHPHPLQAGLVRVLNGRGLVVGAGLLVSERAFFTCAHVVASALGLTEAPQDIPADTILVDIPGLGRDIHTATVHALSLEHDLALLRLHTVPHGASPAPLIRLGEAEERTFVACGFPRQHADGIWIQGQLRGRTSGKFVQLETSPNDGSLLGPGFSGTPAWDTRGRGVVGILAAQSDRTIWLIGLEHLIALAPELALRLKSPSDLLTAASFGQQLQQRGYRPLAELPLTPTDAVQAGKFDFIGVHWTSNFAFVAATLSGDGRSVDELKAYCQAFTGLNDRLSTQRAVFNIGWLDWVLTFTFAGVLCVFFEASPPEAVRQAIIGSLSLGQTYAGGPFELSVQTRATSLCWAVDTQADSLWREVGRQGSGWNFHTHWTNRELEKIAGMLREELHDP